MSATRVEITPRGGEASCALAGAFLVPRVTVRRGRHVEVALVAGGAMLLPGDEVSLRVYVGAGCSLRLVDIGGLVVYGREGEHGHGSPSQWHARVDLAEGARLSWAGLPTVVTDAGRLDRSLTLRLAPGATATLRETLVLGRTGERGGHLRADTDVADDEGPLLRETLTVSGADPRPGVLGRERVVDSVLTFGRGSPPAAPEGTTLLELERGGAVVRSLGEAAHRSPLGAVLAGT